MTTSREIIKTLESQIINDNKEEAIYTDEYRRITAQRTYNGLGAFNKIKFYRGNPKYNQVIGSLDWYARFDRGGMMESRRILEAAM